jgi:cell division protein FtsX
MRKLNKKGAYGIEVVQTVLMSLFVLALFAIAIFAGASALNNSSLFTAGSQAKNDTTSILNNLTSGTTSFFSNIPTFMSILVIVVIFIFLGLMIGAITYLAVKRKGDTGM